MAQMSVWERATQGTYADRFIPRSATVIFVVIAFALALLPLVGMAWARTDSTTENRELAEFPTLSQDDGMFNWSYLPQLGTYFDDHFAYRNEAVTANAHLRAAFGVSATDQVVVGSDGWLFYGGTLPDYLGLNQLSDQDLQNIAHNMKLAQDYVEAHGASFAFTLAPNKNTLDNRHMPAYYLRYGGASNSDRLKPLLEAEGVHYVDLFDALSREGEKTGTFGYLQRDSHWNNKWALLAGNRLLMSVGCEILSVNPEAAVERVDFQGDLQSMLYPAETQLEANYYYAGLNDTQGESLRWRYENGSDVTDSMVSTVCDEPLSTGTSLLMFRDSFGNAVLPFMASSFERATFSKLVPYNLTQMDALDAEAVVFERAERHLDYLASNPPIMPSPSTSVSDGGTAIEGSVKVEQSGSYWVVDAQVDDQALLQEARPYLVITPEGADGRAFDPFWVSADDADGHSGTRSLRVYLPMSAFDLTKAEIRICSNR